MTTVIALFCCFENEFKKNCVLCKNFISIYKINTTLHGRLGYEFLLSFRAESIFLRYFQHVISAREDKICIPAPPCSILYFCWILHNIKHPSLWLHYIPSNRNGKIENWEHLSPHVSSEKVSYDGGCNGWVTSLTYSNNTTKGKEPPERLQSKRKNRG